MNVGEALRAAMEAAGVTKAELTHTSKKGAHYIGLRSNEDFRDGRCPHLWKIAYETREYAWHKGLEAGLTSYHCPCGRWHLTSKAS